MPSYTNSVFAASESRRLDWGERLAIWTFRCVPQETRSCPALTVSAPSLLFRDLRAAVDSFRVVHRQMVHQQGRGLSVASVSCLDITRDERHLLKATAFAQAEAHDLVDNFLFRLAPGQQIRKSLSQAIVSLACSLGASGYWLPANDPLPARFTGRPA